MPGEVRIVDRPESESSYIRAISKGLGITFKHFMHADKPTQQYPDEKWELGPRWRGTHRMAVHEDGRPPARTEPDIGPGGRGSNEPWLTCGFFT